MNIVYAVKIFGALSIIAFVTRLIAGPGLRAVLDPTDFKKLWVGVFGTLVISCFSFQVELLFITLPIWALVLSNMLGKGGAGRLPAYGLLCCICPPMQVAVQHLGPVNDVILLTPFRILSIFLLLPEALRLASRRDSPKRPAWLTLCDLTTLAYSTYWLARHFGVLSATVMAREATAQTLDSLLPYYVLTRACVTTEVRHRFLGFVLAGAVYQAFNALAESLSGHTFYSQLQWLYGIPTFMANGLMRGSWLRAMAAFPGPLPLAMLMLFGLGVWFALKKPRKDRGYLICLLALIGGLLATYGRGQILAGGVFFGSIFLLRYLSAGRYLVTTAVSAVAVAGAWRYGLGEVVTNVLSALSAHDATADFNILYRQELLETALALLQQSPWFGVPNFIQQMQDLKQGEGIIDLVNTYLVVALNSGLLGLALAFTPFLITLWRAARTSLPRGAASREGIVWVALTVAVMAAIFTVSPISIIQPIMVWIVALPLARMQSPQGLAYESAGEPPEPVDLPLPIYPMRGRR